MKSPVTIAATLFFSNMACLALAQVPAVMYHAHENLGYNENHFRDHMDFLVEHGFTTIDMDQFLDWYENDAVLPFRPIIITVDDNYILGYTGMYPIFRDRGMVAINYTHTRGIGIGSPKASWAQVREMDESGVFLVESHSRTHPRLTDITPQQLIDEVHGSRDDIFDNVNGKVSLHFCYPFGNYNQNVIDELIRAGYRTAITTETGLNFRTTPLFELRRWGGDGINVNTFRNRIQFDTLYFDPPGEGWLLDDADPHAYYDPDAWVSSTSIAGYHGPTYRTRNPDVTDDPGFRWAAYIPHEGHLRVHTKWSAFDNRSTRAVYIIRTASGEVEVVVDQTVNGGEWVSLGSFPFAMDEPVEIFLQNDDPEGFLIADAIWLEPVDAPVGDIWILR